MLVLGETAAPGRDVNKGESDLNGSHPELKKASTCENDRSAEAERSRYFPDNNPQSRLGEDFFSQPCISLAKALLGKVREFKTTLILMTSAVFFLNPAINGTENVFTHKNMLFQVLSANVWYIYE